MSERSWGFRTRAVHAGAVPDATTGARATPIYQTTSFVFEDTTDAASLFALQKYGLHLQPDRQPDGRGVRGAAGQPGGRARRRRDVQRAGRRVPHVRLPRRRGRPHRRHRRALRRHDHPARRHAAPLRRRHHVRAGREPADVRRGDHRPATKLRVHRGDRQPVRRGRRPRGHRRGRPRRRGAAHRGRHHGHALPVPPDRARRRHRDPLGHQVPRRARHHARRRGRRVGAVRLEPLPADDRARRRPTAGSRGGATSRSTASSPSCAPSSCATSAPRSPRTARSCCSRASRRCRSGWTAHVANARVVAEWLAADPRVSYVSWAGLPDHPDHDRARRYLPLGPGVGLRVRCARAAGPRASGSSSPCSSAATWPTSATSARSCCTPASTTHRQLTPDQLAAAGVPEDLVRISVGLEDPEDILWDLDQALAAAAKEAS